MLELEGDSGHNGGMKDDEKIERLERMLMLALMQVAEMKSEVSAMSAAVLGGKPRETRDAVASLHRLSLDRRHDLLADVAREMGMEASFEWAVSRVLDEVDPV